MMRTAVYGSARRLCLVSLLLLAMPGAMAATEPLPLVQDTSNKMLAAIKAERAEIDKDKGRLFTLVEKIVLPHFDFSRMSSWVLGWFRTWQYQ